MVEPDGPRDTRPGTTRDVGLDAEPHDAAGSVVPVSDEREAPTPEELAGAQRVVRRRVPRYRVLIVLGVVVGVVVAVVLSTQATATPEFPRSSVLGYLVAGLGIAGGLLGGLVGVVLERLVGPRGR